MNEGVTCPREASKTGTLSKLHSWHAQIAGLIGELFPVDAAQRPNQGTGFWKAGSGLVHHCVNTKTTTGTFVANSNLEPSKALRMHELTAPTPRGGCHSLILQTWELRPGAT